MAGAPVSLEDFYKTFWHCDVKKDHPEAYSQGIAPDVLQDILPQGGDINEELFSGTCFHNLFNYVVSLREANPLTRPFDFFKNHIPITENFNDPIPNIQVTDFNQNNIIYEYVCIHRDSFTDPDTISNLQSFLGSDIVKFTDTHAHIDDLHTTWSSIQENRHKIYQVRSREIQMDPASKIIPSSCGDPNMYYLEKKPDANSLFVEYPRYTRGDPASYFYSKYPVFLDHRGYEQNGYNLKTQFSYKKGSRKIVVGGDRNTANVKTDLYFAALANSQRELEKELIEGQILAKAHGDIGQVLGLFRDMDLMKYPVKAADNNPNYSQEVNTFTGLKVFESHDTNPITKAFTLGIDCIWMHVLGHDENKKLIVFKKQKFGSEEEQTKYDEARLASRITSLKNNIKDLSGNLVKELISANAKLSEFYQYIRDYSKNKNPKDIDYKSILKRFAWLSIISASIRDMENYVKQGKSLFDSITPLLQEDINAPGLERKLQTLSNQLYTLQDIVDIDLTEGNFESFKMEDVGGVLIESGGRTMWKNKVYETVNLFDCIDLDDGGARSVRASETKSLQSWGISIIHDLYFGYHLNKAISDIFIRLLYNTLGTDANKKKKFKDLLSTIEILDVDNIDIGQNLTSIEVQIPVAPVAAPQEITGFFSTYYNNIKSFIGKLFTNFSIPSPTIFLPAGSKRKREPFQGGSKYSNKTFKRKINKKRTTYKQKGGAVELSEEFVNTLITEIREQVDFLINITYATKLEKNITKDILDKWWGDIQVSSPSEIYGNLEMPKEKSCSYSVNEIQTMITILLSLYNSSERKEEISRILFDIKYMLLSFHRDLDISGVKDISGLKARQEEFLKDNYDIEYLEDVGEVKRRRVEDNQGVDSILDEALGVPDSAPGSESAAEAEAAPDSGERTPVNQGIGSQAQLPKSGNSQASTAQLPLGSPLGSFQQPLSLAEGSQPSGEGSASASAVVSPFGSPGARRRATTGNKSSSDSEGAPPPPPTRRMNLEGGSRRKQKNKNKNKKKSKNPLYSKTYKRKI